MRFTLEGSDPSVADAVIGKLERQESVGSVKEVGPEDDAVD
jgi:hypothetical protein